MTQSGALRSETAGEEAETAFLRFCGQTFELLPSGAMFWRAEETLLVADLHLEKLSSFARTGQLLPPYDTRLTLGKLERDINRTGARRVMALGDSFHRDEGTRTLPEPDRARLDALTTRAEWFWLSGNHDPSPHALGGRCLPVVEIGGVTFTHEPGPGVNGLVAGHLHPAARVVMNGRSVRRPCFVQDGRLLILPAYGSATGNLNILGPAFAGLFRWPSLEVTMLGRERLYPVNPRRLVAG